MLRVFGDMRSSACLRVKGLLDWYAPVGVDVPFGETWTAACLAPGRRIDVGDETYAVLRKAGLPRVMSPEDHPWDDRGFGVADLSGVEVCGLEPIPPSAECAQFFNEARA